MLADGGDVPVPDAVPTNIFACTTQVKGRTLPLRIFFLLVVGDLEEELGDVGGDEVWVEFS